MTWATIEREIARLDAIGRVRALSGGEAIQLEKLVRMEQRSHRMAEKRAAPGAPPIGGAAAVLVIAGRDRPAIGDRVRFTCPTSAGPRTYEATVAGFRSNRGSAGGWVETVDDVGFRRSVAPARCEVVSFNRTAPASGLPPAAEGAPSTGGAPAIIERPS